MIKYKRYERYKDSGVEWIGEIPEHWEVGRLKSSIKSCRNGIWGDEPQGDNDDVACIRVADFNRTNMEIEVTDLTIRNVPASKQKMYLLKHGDLLIEKSGGGEKQPVGFVTIFNHNIPAVYANFIAKMELVEEKAYSGFYKYVHSAMYSVRLNVRSIKQTTGIQNLDTNYYFEESVIYPPLNEQKSIANFLDQKTAEIDGLIADKEKLIELLQEKRQAVITEAVTKGLNPNVRLKDSGIEWIGEIPEHWNTSSLRWYVSIKSGDFISQEDIDVEGKIPVIGGNGLMSYTNKTNCNYKTIAIGRVGALCGNVHLIRRPSWITDNALFITNLSNKLYIEYLFYVLKALDLNQYANKTAQPLISGSLVKSRIIPIPPIVEQAAIADFLDQKTAEIDDLITEIKLQIQKLKEYRQSLISEAVTGKIDVREFGNMSEVIYYEQNNSPCSEFTHIAE